MKIICIGRNYLKHIDELNSQKPDNPVFFLKPESALLRNNNDFYIPFFSNNIHYELELVVKINRLGKHIDKKYAHRYYNQIGLGIDFTARDLQEKCKENGLPWEISKAFDNSAAISKFKKIDNTKTLSDTEFHLIKNNQTVQKACVNEMIFSVDTIISYVSQFLTLKIGDLIFTGTPSGVDKVEIGDNLRAYLNNEELLNINIK